MGSAPGRLRSILWLGIGSAILTGCASATPDAARGRTIGQTSHHPYGGARNASLVIDGVTVVDVEQGKLLPDQRVAIAGNRHRYHAGRP